MGTGRMIVGFGLIGGAMWNLYSMVGWAALGQYVFIVVGALLVAWGNDARLQR